MLDERQGRAQRIFPNDEALWGFDPAVARSHRYANLDPANAQPFKKDDQIGAYFHVSSETWKKLQQS